MTSTSRERLFLLDGMALAYRAYFAFINRPLMNSRGENTSAIYGFVQSLIKILDDEKPEHIAVVFDTREPTFRHTRYPEYKATRQKMPEDMYASMDKLKEVIRAFNIPIVEVPGFEADDIIGTLARKAELEKVITYMVTPDKDFMQLITPHIRMYKPGRSASEVEIVDEDGVAKKFGVNPSQVIDVLGLVGDSSDNIPGVKGIGEKTAIPLIQKYGTMENLYAHVDEVPQKGVREKLIASRDAAFLSRELVTISTDVPVPVDFHLLRSERRNTKELIRLFGELEFRGLAGKLRDTEPFDDTPPSIPQPAPAAVLTRNYQCVTGAGALRTLCATLQAANVMSFRAESSTDHNLQGRLLGFSMSVAPGEAWFVPMVSDEGEQGDGELFRVESGHRDAGSGGLLSAGEVISALKPILENPAIAKVGQNIKTASLLLGRHGIGLNGDLFDTMVASYVLRADGQHSLDALTKEYLQHTLQLPEELLGKGKNQKTLSDLSQETLTRYLCEQADMTLQVYRLQVTRLEELKLLELCRKIEFPLIAVLARMEFTGVSLDVPYLKKMSAELEHQIDDLVRDIYAAAGKEFNINSTQQLGDILFNTLQLPTIRKTKTGFSTDAGVLETLRGQHPIIDALLEYRQLTKLKSTYIDALPQLVHRETGRVHTSYNQTVAATGRLSSSDPNLQNIPIRTEIGRAIRKAFVPGSPDSVILSADYSQIELRVMAHICSDAGLLEAFRNNEDIHTSTAGKVFGVAPDQITRDMRRKAKEVNFGIMYGIGPFGLATRLEISQTEAREIIERYFQRFPKVKQYIQDTIASAQRSGFVQTLMGRRRYLPEINSRNRNIRGNAERQAINMPIQGTAADMIKLAMIQLDADICRDRLASRMILQVHDELVFEAPRSEQEIMRARVIDRMKNALSLNVPVDVEVGIGKNWLEAH
jgi:DNA polymerase-1